MRTEATLPANYESPGRARDLVASTLAEVNCGADTVDVARLLVSELVTNVVLHATTDMTVEIDLTESRLHVAVHDGMAGVVEPSPVSTERTGGKGLLLVDALAEAWGSGPSDRKDREKAVWFEVSFE